MKRLFVYLKNYKKETVLGPLFKLLEASFELIVPLVVAAVIDTGIGNHDKVYITKMCGVMVLLGVVGLISSITAQYFAAKAATGFAKELRDGLFEKIQGFSFTTLDSLGSSSLITRMTSDINQLQSGVNMVLRLFLRSPFIVFGAMVMAFTIDVTTAFVFLGVILLLSVIVFGIMMLTIPLYKKVQQSLDSILSITRENLSGIRLIRAFSKENWEIRRFSARNQEYTKAQLYVGKISALMNPLTFVTINIGIVVLIYVGSIRVNQGTLTQGQVVALYNYMSQILVELIKLANLIITITKAVASGDRVADILQIEEPKGNKVMSQQTNWDHGDREYKVEFQQVEFTYQGAGDSSLKDISFKVRPGDMVGIIGGTGSGKSSLVHLICGFYSASKGKILIDGKDVNQYDEKSLRNLCGIVLQKNVLFHGTIEENLRWGKEDATLEEIQAALETAQAREIVEGKPQKRKTMLSQGGKNLSGGQRQRLCIARALVKNPEILILDDATSALDYATEAKLRAGLKELAKNKAMTIFIVSQRTASIMQADKIIVLDEGNMVGMGTHQELIKSCEMYQEIYNSQFKKGEDNEQ